MSAEDFYKEANEEYKECRVSVVENVEKHHCNVGVLVELNIGQ